jgi:predicted Holliday junction resolvase-like endonuclease
MELIPWIVIALLVITIIVLIIELQKNKIGYRKLLSQKKKSEVNLGYVSEKLAPFLNGFGYDPNRLIFIGKPIDYIHFGDNEVTFIEIKSGNSRLTKGQRRIRNLIKDCKVNWYEYRVKGSGDNDSPPSI